jgi:hypothetical protein
MKEIRKRQYSSRVEEKGFGYGIQIGNSYLLMKEVEYIRWGYQGRYKIDSQRLCYTTAACRSRCYYTSISDFDERGSL